MTIIRSPNQLNSTTPLLPNHLRKLQAEIPYLIYLSTKTSIRMSHQIGLVLSLMLAVLSTAFPTEVDSPLQRRGAVEVQITCISQIHSTRVKYVILTISSLRQNCSPWYRASRCCVPKIRLSLCHKRSMRHNTSSGHRLQSMVSR